jgi:hypothetical protein
MSEDRIAGPVAGVVAVGSAAISFTYHGELGGNWSAGSVAGRATLSRVFVWIDA